MIKKSGRKDLISVHDYRPEEYGAYFEVFVFETGDDKFKWHVNIYRYEGAGPPVEVQTGLTDTRSEAHAASQQWAKDAMAKYRRGALSG